MLIESSYLLFNQLSQLPSDELHQNKTQFKQHSSTTSLNTTTQELEEYKSTKHSCCPISYIVIGKLGKGSFGDVFLISTTNGQLGALKIFSKKKMMLMNAKDSTISEMQILKSLDHPFVIKMHCCWQSTDEINALMDYCPGIIHTQVEN